MMQAALNSSREEVASVDASWKVHMETHRCARIDQFIDKIRFAQRRDIIRDLPSENNVVLKT